MFSRGPVIRLDAPVDAFTRFVDSRWPAWLTTVGIAVMFGRFTQTGSTLPIVAVIGGVIALLCLHFPILGIHAIYFGVLIDSFGSTGASIAGLPLTLGKLSTVMALGTWAAHAALSRKSLVLMNPLTIPLGAVFFSAVVAFGVAGLPAWGTFRVVQLAMFTILLHHVVTVTRTEDIPNVMRTMALLLVVTMIWGRNTVDIEGRLVGAVENANDYAALLIMLVPLSVAWLAEDENRFAPLLLAVLTVLFPLQMIQTMSRAGIVCFVLMSPALVWMMRRRPWLLGAAAVCAIVVGLRYANLDFALDRYNTLFDQYARAEDSSLQTRTALLETGLSLWRQNWLLGIGLDAFPAVSYEMNGIRNVMHNSYVTIAAEQGLLGVVTHAYLFWRVGQSAVGAFLRARSRRIRTLALGYLTSLTGFSLMMLTSNDLMTASINFFVLAVGLVIERAAEQENEQNAPAALKGAPLLGSAVPAR